MLVGDRHYRSIWVAGDGGTVEIIDQTRLPHEFVVRPLRSLDEVAFVQGRMPDGTVGTVRISPDATPSANPAFDVTPARLVTGLITERGIAPATLEGLATLFPDRAA